ncbi:MAG: hypothetical protein AUJ92_02255 [Armatimonadetes bacterium CG2_30_59_28]|nr:potassium channel protein [Armatimonadota bacterium]OIO98072.1 MAG: hypothetical protein AUJ92_02255 [Armatimonadetes bacterium CG2_30_59_28]PIU67378.1 MAG: potassium channel protein [Armatimonadetes bacterium CG07_land_8_20_14_0_80_59_28]PIX45411.1 MAG: potassium channel protein [Armatimonadetes bacterium CG_4_8_14_3_um_filter_58_9]PIY44197.1 MAG: potassium channel protein [Armatimonadetes bacterium CG_4_10_14_3_um_filter_59_10]
MTIQNRLRAIVVGVVLIFVGGTLGYHAITRGQASLLDCFYMTVISITTVGYGEVVPIENSPLGRIFTIVVIVSGMGLLTYGVSTLTAFLVEGELSAILGRRKMMKAIDKLNNHFIVVGMGATGYQVICEMDKTQRDFVVIDIDEERLRRLSEQHPFLYLVGDATDDSIFHDAGIDRAEGVVVVLPDDKDNLFVTISVRQLNPRVRIIAKGVESHARGKLIKAGADSVVSPNLIGGLRMVSEMIRPAAVGFLDLMLRDSQHTVRIEDVTVSDRSALCGRNLRDSGIRQQYGLLVMATRPEGQLQFDYNPGPETILQGGMDVVVLGDVEGVKNLRAVCTP